MIKYLIRDLGAVLHYFPYGIAAGLVAVLALGVVNRKRMKRGMAARSVSGAFCFYTYLFLMMVITFFSRETGSENRIDLELFSTFGINARNNAYVIENILLFVPFGLTGAWYLEKMRNLFRAACFGAVTSLGIEFLQLVTWRGVFQIDDILTNTLGCFGGCVLFHVIAFLCRKVSSHSA